VAFQTELLEVRARDRVLEIGTGSGYQTAVLLELGASVYTIERQRSLFLKAQAILGELGYKPHFFFGDGYLGKESYGPYDRILVTAGARDVPESLTGQLKVGGILVVPVGDSLEQDMVRIIRRGDDEFERTEHGSFAFVPMLNGTQE
jgi:protein-L-isoaspartate(D-aspartate) O-methyltransferase